MSDFREISDFRKGRKTGLQYQDPTYLSFIFMFNWHDKNKSPLLAGAAEDFIQYNCIDGNSTNKEFYEERLEALKNFNTALKAINREYPWYWQGVSGLENLLKYNPEDGWRGGEDANLKIECLESINLTITGLMHLYRKAVFDEKRWQFIVPGNLRKFSMFVYVTEVRRIKNMSKLGLSGVNPFDGNTFKPSVEVKNANAGISGEKARPYFMFSLGSCEFEMDSGRNSFVDLKKSPEGPVGNEITISYKKVRDVESRVLNGLVETEYNTDKISPASYTESRISDGIGDFIKDKVADKGKAIIDRVGNDVNIFIDKKKQELGQLAGDFFRANVPNVTNIYQNLVAQADEATDLTKAISLPENIFGLKPKNTIAENLDEAAEAAIGAYDDNDGAVYEDGTVSPGPTEYPDTFMGNIHDDGPQDVDAQNK
jgi:hypothetical protein